MIVSFTHNYIFIRPRKVGGSTIERVLRESLGADDVLIKSKLDALPVRLQTIRDSQSAPVPLHQHMTAREAASFIPAEIWAGAFKFTAIRHPYERVISLAYYRIAKREKRRAELQRTGTGILADDLIERLVSNGEFSDSSEYFLIDGKMAVDAVIRQETLEADFRKIGERIGVPIPDRLPRAKSRARKDRRPAREILTRDQKDAIYAHCRAEFEMFGYER